ncbi:hypothetical protein [Microbacterium trichothecenolyticum]|uniref:hypothetical protein n=1 Tax=Microbacterium trichothecenolyticum TaxID=69370 RepID=UPI0027D8F047|nr:hypothetical protein [Microbacterium trichothecenolyticum]
MLGVRWAEHPQWDVKIRGLLRRRVDATACEPLRFIDWTIDGQPLRDRLAFSNGRTCEDITFLTEGFPADGVTAASLRALLGEDASDMDPWVRYADGRVGLLFCPGCGGLDCGGVSADVRVMDTTVEWRNIGYQSGDEPFDAEQRVPVFTLHFDRTQYEATVRALLVAWDS